VLTGRDPLELTERRLPVSPVVQDVAEVDAGLVEVRIKSQGTANLPSGSDLVPQTMQGVAERGRGVRTVRAISGDLREDVTGVRVEALSIERPPHGQHQLHVFVEAHRLHPFEEMQRGLLFTEPEQGLSHSDQRVFMRGVEHQCAFESASGPGVLLTSQAGVAHPYTELDRIRVQREALFQ